MLMALQKMRNRVSTVVPIYIIPTVQVNANSIP